MIPASSWTGHQDLALILAGDLMRELQHYGGQRSDRRTALIEPIKHR